MNDAIEPASSGNRNRHTGKEPPLSISHTLERAKVRASKATPAASDRDVTELLDLVTASLEDAKAEEITTIDLEGKSSLGDYMIIASGRSDRHVGAIADQLARKLKDDGRGNPRIEGTPVCDWVVIDAGAVIVHVFRPEVREFYKLEKIWSADRPDEADRTEEPVLS